ncbi:MAG TPA: metallophosphoesterase [Terriglobales bacterium]|jgi:hypothetical protein
MPRPAKKSRNFAKPKIEQGNAVANKPAHELFYAPPKQPAGDLVKPLSNVLPQIETIAAKKKKLVFHMVGDTGGVYGTETQDAVAAAMVKQIASGGDASPEFLYLLGDVVYFNGQSNLYTPQFYEPYQNYDAPIFAIPGNHDGDLKVMKGDPADNDPYSLYGFMVNFCDAASEPQFKHRDPMDQPYCYWRLTAPFVQIIGLYSNVDGNLDKEGESGQYDWFVQQLKAVPGDKWLIVTVHHPCYSLDSVHGGYPDILDKLDAAFQDAKKLPDAVLSGHVHNMQMFSRKSGSKTIPYIICGNGGYANDAKLLHKVQKLVAGAQLPFKTLNDKNVSLTTFDTDHAGFLRVTAGASELRFDYFAVPFDGEADTSNPYESVAVDASRAKTPS